MLWKPSNASSLPSAIPQTAVNADTRKADTPCNELTLEDCLP